MLKEVITEIHQPDRGKDATSYFCRERKMLSVIPRKSLIVVSLILSRSNHCSSPFLILVLTYAIPTRTSNQSENSALLNQQLLNFELHPINARFELRCLVGGDGARNHWTRYTASTPQGNLTEKVHE